MPRGGARKGAGRPRGNPKKYIYVETRLIPRIREFIKNLLKSEKTN